MAHTFDARQFQARLERLDALLREIESSTDSAVRAQIREIMQATLDLHGVGLERLLDLVADAGETGRAAGRIVALYPSPAGATEAHPPPDAWQMLVEDNPFLSALKPDVEALLVNRLSSPPVYYRVGIDKCYELVGLIHTHWRGLSGGKAVAQEIDRFFAALKERAHPMGGAFHA